MGIFTKLKKMFGKTIALEGDQQKGLVIMYPLKNGSLKINSEIVIKDDFGLLITHYDKICDYLVAGTYRVTIDEMPKLSKFTKPFQTKKGQVNPKSVKADLYYINLKESKNLAYKSGRIKVLYEGKKAIVKFDGIFNVQITDGNLFARSLLRDFAIIRPGLAEKEVSSFIGRQVKSYLNANLQSIFSITNREDMLSEAITKAVSEAAKQYGINVSNIKIKNVFLPKQCAHLQTKAEQDQQVKEQLQQNAANLLEEAKISQAMKNYSSEFEQVYASGTKENSTSKNARPSISSPPRPPDPYENYSKNFKTAPQSEVHQPPPNILNEIKDFLEDEKKEEPPQVQRPVVHEAPQKKEIKICASCGGEIDNNNKFCPHCGKSTSRLVTCSSCGAKNEATAAECMVCKSKI